MRRRRKARRQRTRSYGVPLMTAVLVMVLAGCGSTLPIGRLLDDPHHFDGRSVRVEGEVVRSAGALGYGTYQLDDGTGTLVVVSDEHGAPREGARVRVKGRFQALLTVGRTSVAGMVEKRRRLAHRY